LALEKLRGFAAPAVPQLQRALAHEDLWLRIKAADALGAIGSAAMPALPAMLERVIQGPSKEDPRGMEQRYFSSAIFHNLLNNAKSLEGVDRQQLREAITKSLQNQDGRARGEVSRVYQHLSFEDIQLLIPAINEAILKPAPSGEMFADEVRLGGLKVLAKHHVAQGIQGCVDYLLTQNPWASQKRTPEILKVLEQYGAQAQGILPRLQEIASQWDQGEPDFPKQLSKQKADAVRDTITKIQTSQDRPELKGVR
jgi:hypothetical protein